MAPDMTKAMKLRKVPYIVIIDLQKIKTIQTKKNEGNTAFKSGRNEEAYSIYSEALEIDPELDSYNAVLFANRAASLKSVTSMNITEFQMKKFHDAIEDLSRAIDLDPQYQKAYIRRGQCYVEIEQFEEAIRDYEYVLQEDPENGQIRVPYLFSK